ncbi:PREDICTED: uncharacterized protein LOC105149712 [Acromyrmex echinatior]|uniref:uncharacterized protein LOC105149712 n=1 Tax=Acromyrmex echinatior TaxID=103372 RepID=UPI000580F74F|nr:PREDICTED: uncharacterized protein LOC105149712 [Acromyrmex echinatior]
MKYYVPIQQDDACKRHAFSQISPSKSRYMPRIFMRKYALTSTVYKFLDIGIIVESIFCVQITIDDNSDNRMFIPHTTSKTLIKERADIERLMQSTVSSSSPIQDLNMEHVKIYDTNNVKLILNGTCLNMKPKTVLFLFELE